MIAIVMWPSLRMRFVPKLSSRLSKRGYAIAAAHGVLGALAEIFGLFILLVAGTNILPHSWRFQRWKLWMRIELALWRIVLLTRLGNLLLLVRGATVALKMFTRRGLLLLTSAIPLCIGLVGLFAQSVGAQSAVTDTPDANPGRPTVSTPATLTPVGYLQFETGVLGATTSPEFSTRYGFTEVIKLSVAPRLEFFSSLEPAVHFTAGGNSANGMGEVFVGAQAVIIPGEGDKPTVSVSYSRRAYDGDAPELDLGSPRNSLLFLASGDVKGFHYDTNAVFNEIVQGKRRKLQFGQTLSISHPFARRFGISGEIWRFTQPLLKSYALGNLWALSYTPRKNLVFDAGFEKGLTGTSTRWEVFAGFTYLLPHRLWRPLK